jgi:cytochrome P450
MIKAPGPQGHYLKGNSPAFNADPLAFLYEQYQQYGDFFRFRLGLNEVFVISDLDEIQKIFNSPEAFTDKQGSPRVTQVYQGSLSRIEGSEHLDRRRLLAPAFTWDAFRAVGDTVATITRRQLDTWQDGASHHVQSEMRQIVLESFVHVLLGEEGGKRANDILRLLPTISTWMADGTIPEEHFRQAHAELKSIVQEIAQQRLHNAQRDPTSQPDLLQCLLGGIASNRIHEEVLIDDIAMILMTSIPTISALQWVWYYLAIEPEVRAKACLEVAQVVGDAAASSEHYAQLRYVEHVMAEAMRLNPAVWTLARAVRADWKIDQYTIPAGSEVLISPYLVHRCAKHWPDPDRFAPERYEETSPLFQVRPRLALLTYGVGPRKCIGERLARLVTVLTTASVLQRFYPELPPEYKVNPGRTRPMRPGGDNPEYARMIFRRN